MFYQSRIGTRYRSSHLCRLLMGRYVSVSLMAGYLERHETPWNAKGRPATLPLLSSPDSGQVNGSRTSNVAEALRHACVTVTSRYVTLDLGGVQALPRSCLGTGKARIVHASSNVGGPGSRETGTLSTAGRSPSISHPQLAGRPRLMTSGGMVNGESGPLFPDRPLNSFFINVQKKGYLGARKTQQQPTHNPLGFLWGPTC